MSDFQAWVASRGGACWPASEDQFLWVSTDRRRSAVLDRAAAVLWQMALGFQPRSALIAAAQQRQSMPLAVAEAAFARLQSLGLIVTPDAMIGGDHEVGSPPPPPVIAVRTYRRPQALERLLASALAMQRDGAVPRPWLVIDDARDDADAAPNIEVVTAIARAGLDVMYLGPGQRREALASLPGGTDPTFAALLDPVVLSTASGSRSWNWAMLLTAGGTVSMIDDDCFLPVRRPAHWRREWSMQNSSANEGRFYDGTLPMLPAMQEDPWEEAAAVLGRSPGALARRDGLALRQIAGKTLEQLLPWQAGRRVAAVVAGIHGGHVFNSALYLNITDAHSLRDLLRAPFSLQRLQGDALWQGVSVPRLTASAVYTPFLLDNRALVPFAPTAGRADDTVFLGLLSAMAPESNFAMLPMLVGHAPVEHRDRLDAMFRDLLVDGNTYLSSQAHQFSPTLPEGDRGTRLAAMAAWAACAGARDAAAWQADVTVWRDRVVAGALDALEQSLRMAGPDAPGEWRQAVARAMAVNRASMAQPASQTLIDEARHCVRQLADAAGPWMHWWMQAEAGWANEWRARLRVRG
jgi:hypothetical protein